MRNILALLLLICFSALGFSQNLVLNPSFESYKNCPQDIGRFNNNVAHWSAPSGTTDYMNSCSRTVGFKNFNGVQRALKGKAYAGLYAFSPNSYREYAQGKLSSKLEKGKKYKLTYSVSLAEFSTHAIRDFSVVFTNRKINMNDVANASNISIITPKKLSKAKKLTFNFYHQNLPVFYKSKQVWLTVSIPFVAKGYETHFTIGNFENNKKTKKIKLKNSKQRQFAYYYLDDVRIELAEKVNEVSNEIVQTIIPAGPKPPLNIEKNKEHIFKNVLFEFDKSDLKPSSRSELNYLAVILKRDKNLKVEIYGHTDNTGTQKRNLELSKERAKAVADYLIYLQIDDNRIQWFGFGSTKPIATNKTEEGKTKNRRVAFKLF